jgi:YegS/Rv2252/BmrU family lipid kinase
VDRPLVIHNPRSGSGEHDDAVLKRVELLDYAIEQTAAAGDAITLARDAADSGRSTIVAAGGDGTVNEVVRGIDAAGAFEDVTLGIIPLGTGNNFAGQLGIPDLDTAFSVLQDGERRPIDLGRANDRPFVNSCVAGLTADASDETSPAMKDRLGVLAYLVTTLRSLSGYDSPRITIEGVNKAPETEAWTGEALGVLIGNGRRFAAQGGTQADMEDGRFEIAVIKNVPAIDLMSEAVSHGLLGGDAEDVVRFRTASLTVRVHDQEAIRFSLDGEIVQERQLSLDVRPRTVTVAVGDTYEPDPD